MKLFISVISTHPIYPTTNNASSHKSSIRKFFFGLWKKMTTYAMSFFTVYGTYTSSSKKIYSLGNKFKVLGVTTRMITTNMVKYWNPFPIFRSWNWFNKPCVYKSMYSICFSSIPKGTIAESFCGSPIPAVCNRINRYFGEKTFLFTII